MESYHPRVPGTKGREKEGECGRPDPVPGIYAAPHFVPDSTQTPRAHRSAPGEPAHAQALPEEICPVQSKNRDPARQGRL